MEKYFHDFPPLLISVRVVPSSETGDRENHKILAMKKFVNSYKKEIYKFNLFKHVLCLTRGAELWCKSQNMRFPE